MARKICCADGNFTTAATWALCSTAAGTEIDVESIQQLSTSDHDSQTFTLPAEEIDGVALKLAVNAQTPGLTLTVHLRNNTTATNSRTVTVNATDMPIANSSLRNGGWMFFLFSSPLTPNGTDTYLIRCTISTGVTISLFRDATTNNFSRFIRRTTTGAPAATDRLIITRELTGAGTGNNRSVTYNNTSSDIYGESTGLSTSVFTGGGAVNAAFCVCHGATITWGTAGSTNYLLRLTGPLMIYSGGTWIRGSSGSPIPRTSTAIVEFVQSVSLDSGFGAMSESTITEEGESRSSGNDTIWCLLNTDEAIGQTVLGVDTDTGWLAGDEIAIASTTRTQNQAEVRILNNNATATELEITVGLTNAHGGSITDGIQAEVILLTRNVITRSDNAAQLWKVNLGGTYTIRWVMWRYSGAVASEVTTTTKVMEYCSGHTVNAMINGSATFNNFTFRHNVVYMTVNGVWVSVINLNSPQNWEISDIVGIFTNGGNIQILSTTGGSIGEVHHIRVTCSTQIASAIGSVATFLPSFGNIVMHSSIGTLQINAFAVNSVIENIIVWRNANTGISIDNPNLPSNNVIFKNLIAFGNSNVNVAIVSAACGEFTFVNPVIAGDTSFATTTGLNIADQAGTGAISVKIIGGTFGGGGGTKTTHTTRDIILGGSTICVRQLFINNTNLLSTTPVTFGSGLRQPSFYARQSPDGTLANTHTQYFGRGVVAYNTSIVHSPFTVSEHLIPNVEFGATLTSSPYRIVVASGIAPTIHAWVRYSSSYNGGFLPRLVLRANPSIGVDNDVIIATMVGAADTWEELTDTCPTPTTNGKMEFVIEITGSADGAFVSEFTAEDASVVGPIFWFDGLAGGDLGVGSIPSGGGEHSAVF